MDAIGLSCASECDIVRKRKTKCVVSVLIGHHVALRKQVPPLSWRQTSLTGIYS